MVKIYFDESRNTGEISLSATKLNYSEQRYFILVGFIDDQRITNEYLKFKNKYISKMYPNLEQNEIKGTDLLKRQNNEILDEFITDFIKGDNLLITIYDKKYFVVTSLIVWLFGSPFKDKEPIQFYTFCEFLIKVDETFLGNFINTINYKSSKNIKMFLEYIVNYSYDECITIDIEKKFKMDFITMVKYFHDLGEEYYALLKEDIISEGVKIKRRNRNNIVNLTALGETLLLYKVNSKTNSKVIEIYHDEIEIIQDYIKHYFNDTKIEFVKSHDSLQIQLADNVSSIVGKFINSILPVNSDINLREALTNENIWIRKRLSKIFEKVNNNNIKMVVHLREQAFLKTYTKNTTNNFINFKRNLLENLDIRFIEELKNHMSLEETYNLLK